MNRLLGLFIFLCFVVSCRQKEAQEKVISTNEIALSIHRFEQQFYTATPKTLPALKKEYPYLFPVQTPDSVWLQKINNAEEKALFEKTTTVFASFETEKAQIKTLFKHIKHNHKNFKVPKIITLITHLDYEHKVIYADSLLLVSLDMFLGKNSEVYQDFPAYLSQNFEKSHLQVAIAKAIGTHFFNPPKNRQFINMMVNEGKKMYMIDRYLPKISDAQKIGYSANKLAWAQANEMAIWKYFIENKLLYSTQPKLYTRFIANAPFSKFYIDIDKDSPGRIGIWMGWQIVRSYMKNNSVTLQQLLQTNAEEIFKKSKYKPKK